jgi:hypothetical protein
MDLLKNCQPIRINFQSHVRDNFSIIQIILNLKLFAISSNGFVCENESDFNWSSIFDCKIDFSFLVSIQKKKSIKFIFSSF